MGVWEYFPNPVEVWNGTTYHASYSTLKGAFDKINDGTWTGPSGDLIVKFRGNTTEPATAVLNASGTGSSSYTHLHIYPARKGVSISGSISAPLIDLNGCDNVVFDGRKDGTGFGSEFVFTTIGVVSNEFKKYTNAKQVLNSLVQIHILAKKPTGSSFAIERPKLSSTAAVLKKDFNNKLDALFVPTHSGLNMGHVKRKVAGIVRRSSAHR